MPRINAVSFRENPSIESICQTIVAAGFDSLEVSRSPFYDKLTTPGTRRRFAEWAGEIGLGLYGFDCWVEVEPYEGLDETLQSFRSAVEWAADLDVKMIISHDPWARVNGARTASECLRINVELFRQVAEMCEERSVRLIFEPHPDTLSMDNGWAIDFIDAVSEGHPAGLVGLLYDCCHYGVGQPDDHVKSIATLGQRIRHVHFSDGDATTYALHLPLGDGVLDLEAIVEALRATGFDGTLTNDLFNYPLLENGARRNVAAIVEVERKLGLSAP